jgi:CheY-like chemotaxis protein
MKERELIDTLRLRGQDLDALLYSLRSTDSHDLATSRRRTQRWAIDTRRAVLTMVNEHGNSRHYLTVLPNLSSGGFSALHGGFLHPGSQCIVTLPDVQGNPRALAGKIVRCRHLQKNLHELGIELHDRISPREFIDFGDEHVFTRERVDVADLKGTLLIVEDSRAYQRLIGAYFRGSGLELVFATSGDEALARLEEFPDMAFVDYQIPAPDGLEVIRRARNNGYVGGLVLLTADSTPGLRKQAIEAGASEMLSKPCAPEALHQAAAEYLLIRQPDEVPAGNIYSDADPKTISPEMIRDYIGELQQEARQITKGLDSKDIDAAREAIRRIRSTAAAYGFGSIGAAAREALTLLETEGPEAATVPVQRLISACKRANPPKGSAGAAAA